MRKADRTIPKAARTSPAGRRGAALRVPALALIASLAPLLWACSAGAAPGGSAVEVARFVYYRSVVVPGRPVPYAYDLHNGPQRAEFSLQLRLPPGASLVSGAREVRGVLAPGEARRYEGRLVFDRAGVYRVSVQVRTSDGGVREADLELPVRDVFWRPRRFLLSAYNPPFATHGPPYDDDVLRYYQDANFDHLLWVRDDPELLAKVHDFGFRYYLDVADLIGEEKLRGEEGPPGEVTEEDLQRLEEAVLAYRDDPLLTGYYICDEPFPAAFANIAKVVGRIRSLDPARPNFVNLYPYFSEEEGSPDYLEAFLQTVRPELLSFDRYIFYNGWDEKEEYLAQLGLIRRYALAYDVPFVAILQGVGTNGTPAAYLDWRTPTEDEQRWLVYTSLAYGAHGIVWFHWDHPWGVTGNPDGEEVYPQIQRLNEEINLLGPRLLPLTSSDVFGTAASLVAVPGRPGEKLVYSGSEMIVGVYRDRDGRENHFMLTNMNYEEGLDAAVTVTRRLRSLEYFDLGTGSWRPVDFTNGNATAEFSAVLPPGGGLIFRFEGEGR
ncbi:hypothetical protein ACMC9I_03825 [Deinococcota bacterium DY0809b]